MDLFSTNTLNINKSKDYLDSITSIGDEHPNYRHEAEQIWQGALSYYKSGISPLVGMCIYKNGHLVINRNIGHLTHQQEKIATLETPICQFSTSKIVTAIVIHKLCELGKLSLDDKISHYLPKYTGRGKTNATIADFLTHYSGIPTVTPPDNKKLEPDLVFDRDAILELLYKEPAISNHSDKLAYHAVTSGYLLGEIAEMVMEDTLDNILQTYISQPMGLDCLHFGLPQNLRDGAAKQMSTGISPNLGANLYVSNIISGDLQTAVEMTNDERFYDAFCPSANVHATTQDIGKLMFMLLNEGTFEGKQILQPETVQALKYAPHGFGFDRKLLVPMRFGHGVMYGAKPIGLFGFDSAESFGHLGFTNILCWADPKRNVAGSFMNTGKSVLGTHIPSILKIFWKLHQQL